jgi:hypothetical protein
MIGCRRTDICLKTEEKHGKPQSGSSFASCRLLYIFFPFLSVGLRYGKFPPSLPIGSHYNIPCIFLSLEHNQGSLFPCFTLTRTTTHLILPFLIPCIYIIPCTLRRLKPHERFFITNYRVYRTDRFLGLKGGTAFAITKGIPHSHIDLLSCVSVEATGVCIAVGNSESLLASLYKSSCRAWSDTDIIELLKLWK